MVIWEISALDVAFNILVSIKFGFTIIVWTAENILKEDPSLEDLGLYKIVYGADKDRSAEIFNQKQWNQY